MQLNLARQIDEHGSIKKSASYFKKGIIKNAFDFFAFKSFSKKKLKEISLFIL
uniref:Uncharacterized protein n=1 Tax=viral metagenome TaxID=1070528 RepID=A0A6C0JHU1_9ZZZZ